MSAGVVQRNNIAVILFFVPEHTRKTARRTLTVTDIMTVTVVDIAVEKLKKAVAEVFFVLADFYNQRRIYQIFRRKTLCSIHMTYHITVTEKVLTDCVGTWYDE